MMRWLIIGKVVFLPDREIRSAKSASFFTYQEMIIFKNYDFLQELEQKNMIFKNNLNLEQKNSIFKNIVLLRWSSLGKLKIIQQKY